MQSNHNANSSYSRKPSNKVAQPRDGATSQPNLDVETKSFNLDAEPESSKLFPAAAKTHIHMYSAIKTLATARPSLHAISHEPI